MKPGEQGALLVEALVVSVVVTIALLGTVGQINISIQQRQRAGERNRLHAAIDADLAAIEDRASDLTCCTGTCTLGIPAGVPTADGGTPDVPCATNNRRDDRYFFPQLDDPTTATVREPEEVDAICQEPNRGIICETMLQQFNDLPDDDLTAAGGERQPIVRLNSVQNQPGNQNILQVTYTDTNQGGAVVRVARVVPPMARFCP